MVSFSFSTIRTATHNANPEKMPGPGGLQAQLDRGWCGPFPLFAAPSGSRGQPRSRSIASLTGRRLERNAPQVSWLSRPHHSERRAQPSPNNNWDHARHVQNDGGDGEGEEHEGKREEDPTIASSNVPCPRSWDEFEDIALAAAKLRWNSSDFYRNGRQGQKQDGVDIWGHDDDNRHIGIQCKNTVNDVSLATVKSEIDNADTFEPKLDRLYIATTAKRDAALQKAVREISGQRCNSEDR
jgi:hypothetical protein